MHIEYKQTKINYVVIKKGEQNILYLHGWGGSIKSFLHIAKRFNAKNILIDFPPFGESQEPKTIFTLQDYANIVYLILEKENIGNLSIISHSFGTRVAILLINNFNISVDKLVITGGAGIKSKNYIKKKYRKIKYKIIKIFNKNAKIGSKDYISLSYIMKKTFSNIVNLNLENYAKNINTKTLLIYGNKDKETPLYMAKKFNKLIKNSKLIVYKNCGHFAYLQNSKQFLMDTKTFLRE